jgi:endonuclease/exonuclease/phosphatase family metal-dependent hydrolase
MGKVARRESAHLLLKKIRDIAGGKPVIVTGDFNAEPSDEPIRVLVDKSNPLHLKDTRELSQQPHYVPNGTFNGFQSRELNDQPIDYIFIKGKFTVLKHATLSQSWQGRFSSDHFPVLTRLILP